MKVFIKRHDLGILHYQEGKEVCGHARLERLKPPTKQGSHATAILEASPLKFMPACVRAVLRMPLIFAAEFPMHTGSALYKQAFDEYMRKGTPIDLSQKQANSTTHYIWKTRKDTKVRPSHQVNDGKIFEWNNPPETGHPGQAYGCRCTAESYMPGITEYMAITLSDVIDTGPEWTSEDFVRHYWTGNGRGVTLREIGHLVKIVDAYMKQVEKKRMNQIADEARKNIGGSYVYTFERSYPMQSVVFSVGETTIGGIVTGSCTRNHGALEIDGVFGFYMVDKFTDPADFRVDLLFSHDYDIRDNWGGSMQGVILENRAISRFVV